MDLRASVANKRLTAELTLLDATLRKRQGVGVFFPFWNSSLATDARRSRLALSSASYRPPVLPFSPYVLTSLLLYFVLDRHRDGNPVTATPLDSALTNCDAHNSLTMRSYENCRVSLALPPLFSLLAPRTFHNSFLFRKFRTLSKNSLVSHPCKPKILLAPLPAVCGPTLLSPCSPTCFLACLRYNRCASIRGRNEFPPAFRRNPHRLRAPLLGRQHYGHLRAPLLLRRFRLPRQLSARKAEFPHRPNRHPPRHLRRHALLSAHFPRPSPRPPRFPPRSFAGLSDSCHRLFSARLHRRAVARPGQSRRSARAFCGFHSDFARAGHFDREALRRRHHGSCLQ